MRRWARTAALAGVIALVGFGCGGSGTGTTASPEADAPARSPLDTGGGDFDGTVGCNDIDTAGIEAILGGPVTAPTVWVPGDPSEWNDEPPVDVYHCGYNLDTLDGGGSFEVTVGEIREERVTTSRGVDWYALALEGQDSGAINDCATTIPIPEAAPGDEWATQKCGDAAGYMTGLVGHLNGSFVSCNYHGGDTPPRDAAAVIETCGDIVAAITG